MAKRRSCNSVRRFFLLLYLYSMITFIAWIILFVLCWPLAIAALVLYPLFWLITLPFRLLGIAVGGVFQFLKAIIMLPARLLRRI